MGEGISTIRNASRSERGSKRMINVNVNRNAIIRGGRRGFDLSPDFDVTKTSNYKTAEGYYKTAKKYADSGNAVLARRAADKFEREMDNLNKTITLPNGSLHAKAAFQLTKLWNKYSKVRVRS